MCVCGYLGVRKIVVMCLCVKMVVCARKIAVGGFSGRWMCVSENGCVEVFEDGFDVSMVLYLQKFFVSACVSVKMAVCVCEDGWMCVSVKMAVCVCVREDGGVCV